tara:strand:- start:4281 stop:4799 length:519 start_codon:yes stop_codon:yes gene_type:complete
MDSVLERIAVALEESVEISKQHIANNLIGIELNRTHIAAMKAGSDGAINEMRMMVAMHRAALAAGKELVAVDVEAVPMKKTRAKKATTEEKAEVDVEGNELLAELEAVELTPTEEKFVVTKENVIELFREVLTKDPTEAKSLLTSLGAKTLKDVTEADYPDLHQMMVNFLDK